MTFGELIKTMSRSKLFIGSREKIAVDLLCSADIELDPADPEQSRDDFKKTVKKWIDGNVPYKLIGRYFPKDKINEDEVKKYFKKWTYRDKWKVLQKSFEEMNNNEDNDFVVNCATDDSSAFYQSLSNQLTISLGLTPSSDALNSKEKETPQDETPSEQMCKRFEKLINEYRIAYYMSNELTYSPNVDEFVEAVKREVLDSFISDQREDIYKKIFRFNEILNSFNIDLDELTPSNARQFRLYTVFLRRMDIALYDIFKQIDEDRERLVDKRDSDFPVTIMVKEIRTEKLPYKRCMVK